MKRRSISKTLLDKLNEEGIYHEITELVKIDPYLDMEMRGEDGVMIYYRGGKILTIHEQLGLIGLDENYYTKEDDVYLTPQVENILDYLCKAKHIIDVHESREKSKLVEKEFQQRVVYENNLSANADNTDYFIADVEWADNDTLGGRADIVAFRWNHMEHRKRILQLTLIEVKQGDGAIETYVTKNKRGELMLSAGLCKHYEDYLRFKENKDYVKDVAKDMLIVLKQKKELGLIKGLDKLFVSGEKEVDPELIDKPAFIFLLANYHHYSSALKSESEKLPDDSLFYLSSFMGYGLYKDFVVTKKKLIEHFPDVFNKRSKL
jgi:hypothetical protein